MKSKTPLLIGRELRSLTPAELDDLLKLCGVSAVEIGEPDGFEPEPETKIHPDLHLYFHKGSEIRDDEIRFTTWSKGEEDWSSMENGIGVGSVWCGWGEHGRPAATVKWFLDHGWRWADALPSVSSAVTELPPSIGLQLIAGERRRQITTEGYTEAHDNAHRGGELIDAGLSYIHAAINVGHPAMRTPPSAWPWGPQWWKPSEDPVRNLTKAAALFAAEIDRLERTKPLST